MSLKLSDILRGHIGVGEQRIRAIFAEAKANAPSVLFIDEFQSLFSARAGSQQNVSGSGPDTSDSVGASLTSALALCLDDVGAWNMYAGTASLITIIAATNEPWCVDAGFLRAGRFDKKVFVGPLDVMGRYELLGKAFIVYVFISFETVEDRHQLLLDVATKMTDFFTGADITLFSKNIKLVHLRENEREVMNLLSRGEGDRDDEAHTGTMMKIPLDPKYIWDELTTFQPSVSQNDLDLYYAWSG